MRTFGDIPDEVRRRIDAGERLVLILLDGFGLEFLRRHADHPLVERLEVTPLRSQFPSTTTAHVTTLCFGLPVEQHGLYEWNILEPALDAIICPLRFNAAGSDVEGSLAPWLDPAVLAPGPTFCESLNVASLVMQPREIVHSSFTRMATRGAAVRGAYHRHPQKLRHIQICGRPRWNPPTVGGLGRILHLRYDRTLSCSGSAQAPRRMNRSPGGGSVVTAEHPGKLNERAASLR
jgi:Type I phosphodiesterase / nucleotide pyrophosphatase